MKSFFEPGSIAVAGVSTDPDKMGSIIFANLLANRERGVLKARVYALNPAHATVGGQVAYPSISALPEAPELLVVAVPESQTVGVVEGATEAGVKAAIIITSGYAEVGKGDVEKRIAELATDAGMRVLGPNTIGVVDTVSGVDSLFLRPTKRLPGGGEVASMLKPIPGGVVVVTQSGHLGQAMVEELTANGVGIRAMVGTGNQVDVSVEDVVEYFSDDPRTTAIALYLEGLKDGRRFLEVARRASRKKPLIVYKAGKTAGGARAALTHTASLVGDYAVYQAAFRQAGVVEASDLQELSDFSISLSMLPRPSGNRLVVVTNAGGVGAVATDEALRSGLRVDRLTPGGVDRLRKKLGGSGFISNASLGNPVDLTASVGTQDFVEGVEEVASLPSYSHPAPPGGRIYDSRLMDELDMVVEAAFGQSLRRFVRASYPGHERIHPGRPDGLEHRPPHPARDDGLAVSNYREHRVVEPRFRFPLNAAVRSMDVAQLVPDLLSLHRTPIDIVDQEVPGHAEVGRDGLQIIRNDSRFHGSLMRVWMDKATAGERRRAR